MQWDASLIAYEVAQAAKLPLLCSHVQVANLMNQSKFCTREYNSSCSHSSFIHKSGIFHSIIFACLLHPYTPNRSFLLNSWGFNNHDFNHSLRIYIYIRARIYVCMHVSVLKSLLFYPFSSFYFSTNKPHP